MRANFLIKFYDGDYSYASTLQVFHSGTGYSYFIFILTHFSRAERSPRAIRCWLAESTLEANSGGVSQKITQLEKRRA